MAGQHPGRKLAVEGVAIVASILLAFAIQAWWEDLDEREQQTRVLTALEQELRTNSAALDTSIVFHEGHVRFTQALLEAAAKDGEGVGRDSVDYLLAGVSSWAVPVYERAALDAVLEGSELDVLQNLELRRSIAAWQYDLERAVTVERQDEYYSLEVWMPLLRELTYLPQIWNMGRERIPGWTTSATPTRGANDHTVLLRDRQFVNALLEKKMVHEDILAFQNRLLDTLSYLTLLMAEELDR